MRLPLTILLSLIALSVLGQKLSISIFNQLNLQTILVTPVSGNYALVTGNEEFMLRPNQIIYISKSGDSVKVRDMSSNLGTWKRVSLVGSGDNDAVRINPISPTNPARIYDDNMGFYVDFGRLMVINLVDQDKYIAGVVEAEAGPSAPLEFYKTQALLARTYAIGHIDKHLGEGFNLCDEVHCQAYKGKSTKNPDILKAAKETTGLVVVDVTEQLIVGAFHANCGGESANSGNVWLKSHNYLVSVTDNYCRSSPSANWEIRIPLREWKFFLSEKGIDTTTIAPTQYNQVSKNREYNYDIGGKQIPLSDIRSYFKLRSAFFNVELVSNAIRLKGRGYGHGVGLCQDGAIQMARKGKTHTEILEHYFSKVRIVPYNTLQQKLQIEDIGIPE
jgi:stage II sporulation protein D